MEKLLFYKYFYMTSGQERTMNSENRARNKVNPIVSGFTPYSQNLGRKTQECVLVPNWKVTMRTETRNRTKPTVLYEDHEKMVGWSHVDYHLWSWKTHLERSQMAREPEGKSADHDGYFNIGNPWVYSESRKR